MNTTTLLTDLLSNMEQGNIIYIDSYGDRYKALEVVRTQSSYRVLNMTVNGYEPIGYKSMSATLKYIANTFDTIDYISSPYEFDNVQQYRNADGLIYRHYADMVTYLLTDRALTKHIEIHEERLSQVVNSTSDRYREYATRERQIIESMKKELATRKEAQSEPTTSDIIKQAIQDKELETTNEPNLAIYLIDGIYISGEFDCGSRGIDHNILLSDGITWKDLLTSGVIIVPETSTYISDTIIDELEGCEFTNLPTHSNHIVGFEN